MPKLITKSVWKAAGAALLLFVTTAIPSTAQTFKTLFSFNGNDGGLPAYGPLVQGLNGNLYGTTEGGGNESDAVGTVYRITPGGTFTSLHTFTCPGHVCSEGADLFGGLVLATNGDFYGTTSVGGKSERGTVFKITEGGAFTMQLSLYVQGRDPVAGLIQATDGSFYGTSLRGGVDGGGSVFKITPGGKLTVLYSFCSQTNCADGESPYGTLIQGTDGNFYGTTLSGGTSTSQCVSGAFGCGTVFELTPAGTLTTLYSFCSQTKCTDGASPYAGLVQASDGNFYGTTSAGGAGNLGAIFKLTPGSGMTTLYSFCSRTNCTDGSVPTGGLVQATDGNLYGTTWDSVGGTNFGTIFKITPGGALTTLYSFCPHTPCIDGAMPYAGLVQATNGSFYGTTSSGGTVGAGTVFKLSVGLGPFVETLPTSGNMGTAIKILGTKLEGATGVSFNGTAATFSVVSNTEIKANVPSGATTGFVTVTTPAGNLKSNKEFLVTGSRASALALSR
jgi:uncharacterized repeat protein (TIGR03803 family)